MSSSRGSGNIVEAAENGDLAAVRHFLRVDSGGLYGASESLESSGWIGLDMGGALSQTRGTQLGTHGPEHMPARMSDRMPDSIPGRMLDCMSNRMPERMKNAR